MTSYESGMLLINAIAFEAMVANNLKFDDT